MFQIKLVAHGWLLVLIGVVCPLNCLAHRYHNYKMDPFKLTTIPKPMNDIWIYMKIHSIVVITSECPQLPIGWDINDALRQNTTAEFHQNAWIYLDTS